MDKNSNFKPYIPADKIVPEFTVTSVLIGLILAVVFGAANAYLGLIVGMTVSASIPAAVISMGIIRVILRRDSILENNRSRPSAQPVNHSQQELFLRFLHCSYGLRKEKSSFRAFSRFSLSPYSEAFSAYVSWFRSVRR